MRFNPSRAILVLLVSAGFGAAFWAGQTTRLSVPNKSQSQQGSTIQRNPITKSVSAPGTLEPVGEVHVLAGPAAQIGGAPRIKSIAVTEGEKVYQNQILATFDNLYPFRGRDAAAQHSTPDR